MQASYPSTVKSWTDKQDNVDDVFAGDTNGAYAEIKAIETELIQAGYKKSVRVATTQNGDLATAFANGQVVDGVTLVTDDRILLKNQTSGAENGIYTVNTSGAPTRTTDANATAHMVAGLKVYVREGTVNAKGTWKLTTTATITLDTTPIMFEDRVALHVNDLSTHGDTISTYRSGKDTNGIYTTIEYKRADTTLAKTSVLSGGTSPTYTTDTVIYYDVDGITILSTKVYALTYSGYDLVSKVLV